MIKQSTCVYANGENFITGDLVVLKTSTDTFIGRISYINVNEKLGIDTSGLFKASAVEVPVFSIKGMRKLNSYDIEVMNDSVSYCLKHYLNGLVDNMDIPTSKINVGNSENPARIEYYLESGKNIFAEGDIVVVTEVNGKIITGRIEKLTTGHIHLDTSSRFKRSNYSNSLEELRHIRLAKEDEL